MSKSQDYKTSVFSFNIMKVISDVYHDRHRDLVREFASLNEFEDLFFAQYIHEIDNQLSEYLSRGQNFLNAQKDDGFIDFTYDDRNINFNHVTISEVKKYVLSNALAHLYAYIALKLMDDTDIEDYLNSGFHLIKITKWNMTFEERLP